MATDNMPNDPQQSTDPAIREAMLAQDFYIGWALGTQESLPDFQLQSLIGNGPSGRVFKARIPRSNWAVAVKILHVREREWHIGNKYIILDIREEARKIDNWLRYGPAGVLQVIDVIPFVDTLWIVSPLCPGGSLKSLMKPCEGLDNKHIITALHEVCNALMVLHRGLGSFHGNIKAANVLVDGHGKVKLCDFSIIARGQLSSLHSEAAYNGSIHWLAPEYLVDHEEYQKSVDVWSFGALAYELATGQPPHASLTTAAAIESMHRQAPPVLTGEQYDDGLKDLIKFCLITDVAQRPSIDQVWAHPYLYHDESNEVPSLQQLVNEHREWQARQSPPLSAEGSTSTNLTPTHRSDNDSDLPRSESPSDSESDFRTPTDSIADEDTPSDLPRNRCLNNGSGAPQGAPQATSHSDSEGDFSPWTDVDDPSRCSSPFDLEDCLLPSSAVLFSESHSGHSQQSQPSLRSGGRLFDSANDLQNSNGGVSITIGMEVGRNGTSNAANHAHTRVGSNAAAVRRDLATAFNPDFDVFTSQLSTSENYDPADLTPAELTMSSYQRREAFTSTRNPANSARTFLLASPPVSPSSSPPAPTTSRPYVANLPGPGAYVGGFLPSIPHRSTPGHAVGMGALHANTEEDDDDTSTVRPRDSFVVCSEPATVPSTPPATPKHPSHSKGKEPASSPHAWPPYRHASRSTHDVTSPPTSPSTSKPLPPLPLASTLSFSRHRPSTSDGSSSTANSLASGTFSSFRTAIPPVPRIPVPIRRPSVEIFSPVCYTPSFDANGMYIPQPPPVSPQQPQPAPRKPMTLTLRRKEKSSAAPRERMIPREAGSCPPRRRRSDPSTSTSATPTPRINTSSSASNIPTHISKSSTSSNRSPTKHIPRNASFSIFPAATTTTQNLPPRRPSAPVPSQSFFDYDADDDDADSLTDYDAARGPRASELIQGVRRIVGTVSEKLRRGRG